MIFGVFTDKTSAQKTNTSLYIDSVSVIEDENHIRIDWSLEPEFDEGNFVIHRRKDDIYDTIAKTDNLDTSYYKDNYENSPEKPYSYYISAMKPKNDANYESFASSYAHQTIFIENLSFNICKEEIKVKWTNYKVTTTVGDPDPRDIPFDSTMVILSFDGRDYETIKYSSINDNNVNIKVNQSGEYCIKLRSFSTNENEQRITSTSNIKCTTTSVLDTPDFAYLRKASVVDDEFMRLKLFVDNTISSPAYVIHRAGNQSESFSVVDTINSEMENITYDDYLDNFNSDHKYYFEVLDSCGRPVKKSNTVSSIYLIAEPGSNNENELKWNKPKGLAGELDHYIIKRKDQQNQKFEIIEHFIPHNQHTYTDFLDANNNKMQLKEYTYKIIGVEASGNPYEFKDTVYSNHAKVKREPEVFIPNAFRPGSTIEENRTFKPQIRNAIPEKYQMIIYNKWGQSVFQTDDYNKAWDGSIDGKKAPGEIYLYKITIKTKEEKKIQEQGTINLIR